MAFGVKVEIWGDRALFTRPELSVERMSYDVITPSAARGIIESVYWHPGLRYQIDRIHVLNPIKFTNVRRNEIKSKALGSAVRTAATKGGPLPFIDAHADIQQRASVMLVDVRYVVEAHFTMTEQASPDDNPGKFKDILMRRLRRGQTFSTPYLGTRECSCNVREWTGSDADLLGYYASEDYRDLGLMLYDMDYSDLSDDGIPQNITPIFYRPIMRNGVIDVAGSEVFR